eukprot:2083148-Pyramimonas_sp.AAC.1
MSSARFVRMAGLLLELKDRLVARLTTTLRPDMTSLETFRNAFAEADRPSRLFRGHGRHLP